MFSAELGYRYFYRAKLYWEPNALSRGCVSRENINFVRSFNFDET